MKSLDDLRADLDGLASQVTPVDLSERAVAAARQITRRRLVAAATCVSVLLVVSGITFLPVFRTVRPPAGPAPTILPTPSASIDTEIIRQRPLRDGELANATIEVPAWAGEARCAAGEVKVQSGSYLYPNGGPEQPTLLLIHSVEVTIAGSRAIAATLMCHTSQVGLYLYQVVVYRPAESGVYRVFSQVIPQAAVVFALTAAPDGVAVEIGDSYGPVTYADTQRSAQHQTRTFTWTGTAFVQTAGPTAFGVDPPRIHLEETSTDLIFEPPNAGQRNGRMTVTVRNTGAIAAPRVDLELRIDSPAGPAGSGWTGCTRKPWNAEAPDATSLIVCDFDGLAPGEARSVTYEFAVNEGLSSTGERLCQVLAVQRAPYLPEAGVSEDVPAIARVVLK